MKSRKAKKVTVPPTAITTAGMPWTTTMSCNGCGGMIVFEGEVDRQLALEGRLDLSWCGFCQ